MRTIDLAVKLASGMNAGFFRHFYLCTQFRIPATHRNKFQWVQFPVLNAF